MSQTVGERIEELTKEYCQIFDDLDEHDELKEQAVSIALHDPLVKKHIWSQVEKNVRRYVERRSG